MSEKPLEGDGDPAKTPVAKKTCPNCKKKNSIQVYLDGGEICFTKGCGHKVTVTPEPREKPAEIPRGLTKPGPHGFNRLDARAIDSKTLRRYGTFMAGFRGGMALIMPIYSETGEMVAQLARTKEGENVTIYASERADTRNAQLYGRHVFGDRFDRKVVILSDGLDAMSTGQVTNLKVPAVSVIGGPGDPALAQIKSNYRWLARFKEIVLFFQEGADWDATAQKAAALFDPGQVKIARLEEFASPNKALVANKGGDIDAAIWSASTWRPVGISNARDGFQDILDGGIQVPSWPYPWPEINEHSLGMRPAEVTYHVGGTGIAKTTLMFHYARHLLIWDGKEFMPDQPVQPKCKVGWFGFEDSLKSVKLGMLSIHAGQRLHLNPVPNDEAAKLYKELFGEGGLELYDAENAEYGLDAILGYIKYMVRALDVKVLFIDPMTYLVAGLPSANRTQAEDQVAAHLATIARSTGCHLHIGYHLKKADGTPFEEGGEVSIQDIKGSGALYQFSNNVNAYERNQQGSRPDLLRWRNLKHRAVGNTGVWGILKYDLQTGRYVPTKDKWPSEKDDEDGQGFPSTERPATEY